MADYEFKSIIDFLKCPALYKFKHDNQIKLEKNNGRELLKQALINTVYRFYEYVDEHQEVLPERILNNYWAEEFNEIQGSLTFKNKQHKYEDKNRALEFIKKFYIKYQYKPGIPILINKQFDLDIGTDKITDVTIPLVRSMDDKTEIVFFDTATYQASDDFKLANNLKYTMIAYLYRQIFKEKEDRFLNVHVRKGKEDEVYRTQDDFNKGFSILDNIIKTIEDGRYWQRLSYLCKGCPYSDLCTEWDGS